MARTKHSAQGARRLKRRSPHDALFQVTFSAPQHAASELKTLLSSEIASRIKWDKLRKIPNTFVDAKLTHRFTDILFEVEIDEQRALIYVLFEHKSQPDRWTLLQILEYEVRIWRDYLQNNPRIRQLPLILPVVVHHGPSGWTAAREFMDYFRHVPDDLQQHVPNFSILLDDVGKVSPAKLLARPLTPEAKLVLLCLLLGQTPELFLQELREHPAALKGTWNAVCATENPIVIRAIIVYMEDVGGVPEQETVKVMQDILKLSPAERILFADKVIAYRAERRGEERGRLEGKIEGKIETLSRLLEQRFGSLQATSRERLQEASAEELDAMTLRVLTATTLDDVLGKPKRQKK